MNLEILLAAVIAKSPSTFFWGFLAMTTTAQHSLLKEVDKKQLTVERKAIMKYPDITLGRVEAVWNKLGGEEGVNRFLSDELSVSESTRSWREEDGVIYFSVTSDGTNGEDWIKRLEGNGFRVGDYAKQVLRSPSFVPTSGVTTKVAVLRDCLFEDQSRITLKIRAEADKRKLGKPNAEVSCLIREKFTDKEIKVMGLIWIVAMHEPINNSVGGPRLLSASRGGSGQWLGACCVPPGAEWALGDGFAFAVSQVRAKS